MRRSVLLQRLEKQWMVILAYSLDYNPVIQKRYIMTNIKKSIIPFAFLSLLFLSCTKQPEGEQQSDTFEQHPTWTDNDSNDFWDKQPGDVFRLDTVWNGDTTIYF